jgi:hypothetical protein
MKFLVAFIVIFFFLPNKSYGQEETTDATTDTAISESAHFPLLSFGGSGGFILRNESVGAQTSVNFDFQSDWAFLGINGSIGALGMSPNGWLFTEVNAYGHLLAIGVSDITYRQYLNGNELRFLGGFSYTRSHEDIVRVDVNLGIGYFNEILNEENLEEWGLQAGARIRARFWRFENFLQFSVYQNLEVGTGGIDLTGTEIICDNFEEVLAGGDLMCRVPERDPELTPDTGGLVSWRTTGFLITERLFLNVAENVSETRFGPELEVRVEKVPLRDINFWLMVSFRTYWSSTSL